jgi:serine/threonine-protein kinase PpkA
MSTPELSPDELTELLSGLLPEIPDCRVLRLIGRGGMSFVYLGVQESLDRQVAIKVIAPHALKDEVSKARFEKESRTIAKLQHPCIVAIHAVGRSEQGLLYYVLPYLSKGHLGQRDLTGNDAGVVDVVRALLWALDYAHAHGVVHRDVKAENVLFDNADRPLLADFGIALSKRDRSRMTGDGHAVGSAAHMAPEQARAEPVDGRADLYSLGVLTFEMVCGQLPFQNEDALGLAVMHAVDPVPRLPPEKRHWQEFIDKAMAKRPADRFQDAREMMMALERVVDHAKRASASPLPGRARITSAASAAAHSRAGRIALAVGAAAMLVAAIWFGRWTSTPPQESRSVATAASTAAPPTPVLALSGSDPMTDLSQVDAASATELSGDEAPAAVVSEAEELPPGEAELAVAAQQIARRRLSQPPGDNAFEWLQAAHKILPRDPRLPHLGQRWLGAATPYVADALASGQDDNARSLFARATTLADELQLRDEAAWIELEALVVTALSARLKSALAQGDEAALRRAKMESEQWGAAPARLEPLWSQKIVRVEPGQLLRRGNTSMVLARLPSANRPGLAALPHAVTRQEYAAFVAATGHASARCRIRTARVTLKRRTWERPGFAQDGRHPVVCVSAADAIAYATWLGQRDGQRYRLPQADEWRALGLTNATPTCRSPCKGTASIDAGATVASGLRTHAGSAREWSGDCLGGCEQRASVGASWRDAAPTSGAREAGALKSDMGYDDIGFRLVREVSLAEVKAR